MSIKRKRGTMRTPAEQLAHAERLRNIMALYVAGSTFEQIGLALPGGPHNKGTVYKWWREAMRNVYVEKAEHALVRYDLSTRESVRTLSAVMANPRSTNRDKIKAAESRARIEAQRAEVLGYKTPTTMRFDLSGMTDEQLRALYPDADGGSAPPGEVGDREEEEGEPIPDDDVAESGAGEGSGGG